MHRAVEDFGGVIRVKQHLACRISARWDGWVVFAVAALSVARVVAPPVLAVVNEHDAVLGVNRGRAWLDERRIKGPAPRPKHHQRPQTPEGRLGLVGAAPVLGRTFAQHWCPCQQVDGRRHVNVVLTPEHPEQPVDLLGHESVAGQFAHDGATLGPCVFEGAAMSCGKHRPMLLPG